LKGTTTGDSQRIEILEAGVSPAKPAVSVALLGAPDATLEARDGRVVVKFSSKAKKTARFTVAIWNGAANDAPTFAKSLQGLKSGIDLTPLTKGSPARWTDAVVSKGVLATSGEDGPYVVDTVAETDVVRTSSRGDTNLVAGQAGNPWNTGMFFGGFDFFPDGRAVLCAFHGDVWIVSGIDSSLEKLTWKRFATGLFQPLGLKVVKGVIYVLGRDQITRLHDLNADGEADYYENFNNDTVVTANYHEFCLDLHTDRAGNFYYFKSSPWAPDVNAPQQGTLLKLSPDGAKMEVYASGFRAPNGSAIGPRDEITVSDNQGHWMPASKLNLIRKGGFYGMMPAAHRPLEFERNGTNFTFDPSDVSVRSELKVAPYDRNAPVPKSYDQPIAWLPMNMDNSSGGQVWATTDKWGPLKDHLLFMSYGRGTLFEVLMEEIDGVTQAGMVKFPLKFRTGLMRGRVNPKDGQVYVCGLRGWQTDGAKEGGFYRVRYTSKPVGMPVALNVLQDGLKITFASPLNPAAAADPSNYAIEQWNYLYTGNYGSPDFSVATTGNKGHDKISVKSARLSRDGRSALLEIPGLQPSMQMRIKMTLTSAEGATVNQEIHNTIHKLGKAPVSSIQ
jgi:glucose/arabinose dehydrogenase